jgi:DNA-binding transcriptional MerR regulator
MGWQDVEYFEPTDEEWREAIQRQIAETGFTFEEIREQARRGRFETNDAYWAWFNAEGWFEEDWERRRRLDEAS